VDIVLVRGGRVLTLDDRATEVPRGDVLISDGLITAVGPDLVAPPGAQVLDATGDLVLPGLVDTHRHTWQTPLRHRGAQWSMDDYRDRLLGPVGARYQPEDVYAGTLLGALAALDAGITTLVDWAHIQNTPAHSDASVTALRESGIRAVFAHGWPIHPGGGPAQARTHPADIRRVRTDLLPDDAALVTLAMGARGPDYAGLPATRHDLALARELGIPITAHIASGRFGASRRGIADLAGAGLLGPDLTVVHANGAGDEDLRRLADAGCPVSISPQIELTMPGLGASVAVRRLLDAGIHPGLSVDSETVASADLFTQMRFALAAHRAGDPEQAGPPLPALEVLRMATVHGARTAGLTDRVGSLVPGRAGDLIVLRADAVGWAPVRAAADAVVLAAHPGMVETVVVAGRVLKRDGRLLADVARARDLATATAGRVIGPE
jgi:cytosine/adenosine deaminase-related metal-dependent hydrolase